MTFQKKHSRAATADRDTYKEGQVLFGTILWVKVWLSYVLLLKYGFCAIISEQDNPSHKVIHE